MKDHAIFFVLCLMTLMMWLTDPTLAKINPIDARDYGYREGMLKGISISYKTFREMFKDKKNRGEFLKRLVAEIQAQKVYEGRIIK